MSTVGPLPVPPGTSPWAASSRRQRRLARVRLAELVALRRAERSSSEPQAAGGRPQRESPPPAE